MKNEYSASFTNGALLYDELTALLPVLTSETRDADLSREAKENAILKINSEASRKRYIQEISKRYDEMDSNFWDEFVSFSEYEKKVLLYYVCCRYYRIIREFHQERIIDKWNSMMFEVSTKDFLVFLERKGLESDEVYSWTENTKVKLSRVAVLMLHQAGFLKDNKIIKPEVSARLLQLIVDQNDRWFLDFLFLDGDEKNSIL